ncbi:MAG: DUF2169 domain-containing protein [Thermodesulfobacteriota bacterium]
MRLEHITGMQAGYTMGMRPDGRELLVVCIKGTFTIPRDASEPQLAEEQVPLVEADIFTGEPGFSAPLYESDYAPFKPNCDVLLNGSAYGPQGRPATRVRVFLQVGSMSKSFHVVGNRFWLKDYGSVQPTDPQPFVKMPFSYDTAFGGLDASRQDPLKLQVYAANPIGRGFHVHLDNESVHGKPLPNTEELQQSIAAPNGSYRPMSLGPVHRSWPPRITYAGTYDQNWLDNIFPFLPPDFDERYYQAAPPDQQMPYPAGGELVVLGNLTPEGRVSFTLPRKEMLVWYLLKNGEEKAEKAVLDTVFLEPDAGRFTLTWRSSLPLKRNMFEVEMVVIGDNPEARFVVESSELEAMTASEAEEAEKSKEAA